MIHHPPEPQYRLAETISLCARTDLFETLSNERVSELSQMAGPGGFANAAAVLRSTGVSVRRILQPDVQPVHLAMALEVALDQQNLGRFEDFTTILLCHSHTDPTAAEQLASSLQQQARHPLPPVHAINAGCSGFLQQLQLACHVPHSSRHSRTLLLNIETPEHWHCAADRAFCGLISAAATATIIDQQRGRPIHWLQTADLPVPDSHLLEPGPLFHTETTDSVTFRGAAQPRHIMRMHGEAVFVHAIELMLHAVKNAWQQLPPGSPVTLIPHQPSGKLLRTFAAALQSELPQIEVLSNLEYSGNTISATIPELLACLPPATATQPAASHLILAACGICMRRMHDHLSCGSAWIGL